MIVITTRGYDISFSTFKLVVKLISYPRTDYIVEIFSHTYKFL